MSGVLSAIIVLLIVGAVAALILVIASKYMSVPENEMFPAIRECLPGANCGACGYAAIMGVEAEDVVEMVAYVKCNGNCDTAKHKYEYAGINNCSAANILFQGEWACPNSCLGYGDCENACPSDAIHVVNGVAKVYPGNCTGCGICTRTCPNHIIALRRAVDATIVRCSNTQKGVQTRVACSKGCIGCMKCEKVCPTGAIKVVDNLARIDYDKCVGCVACSENCPVGVIQRF